MAMLGPLPMARGMAGFCGGVALAAAVAGPTLAQQAAEPRLFVNPPQLLQSAPPAPLLLYSLPVGQSHAGTERAYELTIKYTEGELYDPANNRNQKVRLRSYVGPVDQSAGRPPFVAPLIDVAPGDTVRISLKNELPADASCTNGEGTPDSPHCFNGTNLHSHGLWVSPTGNSDNVLLSINPGVSFQYEYNIPADHPAGTFWYHPHRHGSTALQVGSGMAGALIIHGDRKPTPTVNGDLDTLLVSAAPGGKPFTDRTLVFQQIQYACVGPDGKIQYDAQGNIIWSCKPGEVGVVETYNQFGPSSWAASGRWTSVNGIVLPTFGDVEAGAVERWRLIHAGVRNTITVQFRKMKPGAAPAALQANLTKAQVSKLLDDVCTGDIIPYQVVAADGLTMERTLTTDEATLQPGYRYDLLTVFPEAGSYCLLEPSQPANGSVSRQDTGRSLLGFVTVSGSRKIPVQDLTKVLTETLVQSANANMPPDVREQIVRDLQYVDPATKKPEPRLTRFVPHPTVTDAEVANRREERLVFFIGTGDPNATQFAVGNSFDVINYGGYLVPKGAAAYNPDRVDRALSLGTAQQWELRSYSVSHPFHIHVNPFQIVAIYDPQGRDVSLPGVTEADGDSQFAGLKGVWKDTIFVKTDLNPGDLTDPPAKYYRFIIRTRYERYIGEFVLHCHILDHEDQGMMQNVSIGISDGVGGLSHGHH
jgi:L-ascorbate oxidase